MGKDVSGEDGMSISGNEMHGFTSKKVNVGGSEHGGIVVATLTETQTMNAETWVLIATSTASGTITFQDGPSVFRVLDVTAFKGINVSVPSTEGVKTTYFTGTLTFTVTGTQSQGAYGMLLAKGTYLNCATKMTLKSSSGIYGDTSLFLNGASGIQIDAEMNVTSTNEDINVQFNCDTDGGGTGPFILCGSTADALNGASTLCTPGKEGKIRMFPGISLCALACLYASLS